MEMRINPDDDMLRLEEVEVTADFQRKVPEECEVAREQRKAARYSASIASAQHWENGWVVSGGGSQP